MRERALALEDDQALEDAHNTIATRGQTRAPDAQDEVDHHYLCFVRSHRGNRRLYQLDGDRKGPIDLGEVPADADVLSGEVLAVVKEFLSSRPDEGFSLLALAPE